jgi:hypothetical protein
MKYSAVHKALIIPVNDLDHAIATLRYGIKAHRKAHKLPLTRFKYPLKAEVVDMVHSMILDTAKALGLDLGVERPGELDVSDAE